MSIDGVVLCGCREGGRAVPPPCPIWINEVWAVPVEDTTANRELVRAWAETACPHRQFWLIRHWVRKMGLLEAMASRGGAAAFPVLYAALPTHNGGEVAPDASAACLSELDTLREQMRSEPPMAVLLDGDTGTVLWVHEPEDGHISHGAPDAGPRIFWFDEAYQLHSNPEVGEPFTSVWLEADGLIRVRDRTGHELWQSRDFTQETDGQFRIHRDRPSRAEIRHLAWIPQHRPADPEPPPTHLRVEIRPYDSDVAIGGIAGLRELFEASVRTGRPVVWC
jgi:hypothetical protein